jgi:outer membrane protein OmpA-like peptidoglycan-associated protein
MSSATIYYRFTLKCFKCGAESLALNQHCNSCGLVDGHFVSNDPGNAHLLTCSKCEQIVSSKIPPSLCTVCGESDLKWWDIKADKWFSPDLSQTYGNNADTLWLTGEFDGDLIGLHLEKKMHEGATKNSRIFSLEIRGGTLKNVKQIKAPPQTVGVMERVNPIRQKEVNNVLIQTEEKYAAVTLIDFRLHHWSEFKDDQLEEDKVYARIHGQAYGCLNPGAKIEEKLDTLTIPEETEEEQPKSEPQQSKSVSDPQPKEPSANVKKTMKSEDIVSSKLPSTGCKLCSLTFRFWISILVLIFCGFYKALLVFGGITAACLFDQFMTSKNWKGWFEKNEKTITKLLIVSALVAIYYLLNLFAKFDCSHEYLWMILILYICFFVASLLQNCLQKTILCLLWVLALLMLCDDNCSSGKNKLNNFAQTAGREAGQNPSDKIGSNQDPRSSQSTESGKIISLDEATMNPELLKDCRNKLYLPNATLFATDSYKINADSQDNLNQLVGLFAKLDKDSHITITGHSDATGDATSHGFIHNIQLSEQRATAVASWLSTHGALNADRIDVQGVGSKFPLVDDLASAYNRRVEIHLTCGTGR